MCLYLIGCREVLSVTIYLLSFVVSNINLPFVYIGVPLSLIEKVDRKIPLTISSGTKLIGFLQTC